MARRIGAEPVAHKIETTTLEGEQVRRKAAEFYMKFTETYASLGIQLGARYDSSSIIVHDGLAPPDNHPIHPDWQPRWPCSSRLAYQKPILVRPIRSRLYALVPQRQRK